MTKIFMGIVLGAALTVIERYFIHIPDVLAIILYVAAVFMIIWGIIDNKKMKNG